MKFEDAIASYFKTCADLTAQVGANIYPGDKVPQDQPAPYIAHNIYDRDKIYTHSGYSGVCTYSIQFNAYAETKDQAAVIAGLLAGALEEWRKASPTSIGFVTQEGESDGWDSSKELYYYDQDYDIFYRE